MSDHKGSFLASALWLIIGVMSAAIGDWMAVSACAGAALGWFTAGAAERKLKGRAA